MDKIEVLLKKLENNVSQPIAKRLDGLKNLHNRLDVAKKELSEKPNDEELKESYSEIEDYVNDYEEDLIDDLEILVQAKQEQFERARKAERAKQDERARQSEAEKLKELDAEKESENAENKKKSSGGTVALIIGGVLLVASIGAINIFKNNR